MQAYQSQQAQLQEEAKLKQQIEELEAVVKLALTPEALARYGNLKMAHPEKALRVLILLGQAMQQGHVQKITDEALKQVLARLTPEKREIKIKKI